MVFDNIQCSACGAKLKSSTSVPAGKRIRCSKCGAVFSLTMKEREPAAENPDVPFTRQPEQSDGEPLARALQSAREPDERKPLQCKRRKKRLKKQKVGLQKWMVGLACGVAMVALGFGIFLVVQQVRGRIQATWLRENNERVTMENYDKVPIGAKLEEAKAILGDGRTIPVEEVEDSYRMQSVTVIPGGIQVIRSTPENSIREMVRGYTIESWYRWQNKTANVFAGLRKDDDGSSQIAVLGFLNNDPATKSFGAAWKVLPISAEISSSGR